ncbi:putative nuclease HARBI1 isoform X2 [Wyeomyia smithii]|nr:putative nuclease HARBI1 isoform X2 [Wyeomyia smithii]
MYLLNIIEDEITTIKHSLAIPPIIMLAASLRFFAEGSYQKCVGNDRFIGMAQPTFSKSLTTILNIIEQEVCPKTIQFPSEEREMSEIKLAFYRKTGFPGVIGCVDRMHIKIIPPAHAIEHFFNNKSYHSINALMICDHNLTVRHIDAKNPGSYSDESIWNKNSLNKLLTQRQNKQQNSWLLGDAKYPLKPFLITPFKNEANITEQQLQFNEIHSRARSVAEKTIEIIKNTFRCLLGEKTLHYKPEKATQIVNVCVALHNLRIKHNIGSDELELPIDAKCDIPVIENNDDDASSIRNNIMKNIV